MARGSRSLPRIIAAYLRTVPSRSPNASINGSTTSSPIPSMAVNKTRTACSRSNHQNESRRASIKKGIAAGFLVSPNAITAAWRTSIFMSSSATLASSSKVEGSRNFPIAVHAAMRVSSSRSFSRGSNSGRTRTSPIFAKAIAARARTVKNSPCKASIKTGIAFLSLLIPNTSATRPRMMGWADFMAFVNSGEAAGIRARICW